MRSPRQRNNAGEPALSSGARDRHIDINPARSAVAARSSNLSIFFATGGYYYAFAPFAEERIQRAENRAGK